MRVSVTMAAKAISGDVSCLHRLWWEMRQAPAATDDIRLAAWRVNHTAMMRELVPRLEGKVQAERAIVHPDGLFGKADIVQETTDGLVIHEIKTGRAASHDLVQLMLYMSILRDRGLPVTAGALHRPAGRVDVPVDEVPFHMLEEALRAAASLASDEPPPRVIERACSWCPATCRYSRATERAV